MYTCAAPHSPSHGSPDQVADALGVQSRCINQYAFEKPSARYPAPETAAYRAVVERHVPFVAVPALGRPTSRPTIATGRRLPDDAAGHAAAIDGHTHGTAALDGHADGDRRTEAAQASARRVAVRLQPEASASVRLTPDTTSCVRHGFAPAQSAASRTPSGPVAMSSRTGDPQRVSPTSAPRRAISVASVSGDGTAPLEQRILDDAARRRIDFDGDDVDRRAGRDATRGRAAAASAAPADRASAPAVAACARAPSGRRAADRRRSAAPPRSARSSAADNGSSSRASTNDSGSSTSIGHSSSIVDESGHPGIGHERPRIDAARQALEGDAGLTQPRRQCRRRQRRDLAERREPPATRTRTSIADLFHGTRIAGVAHGTRIADLCGSISRDADLGTPIVDDGAASARGPRRARRATPRVAPAPPRPRCHPFRPTVRRRRRQHQRPVCVGAIATRRRDRRLAARRGSARSRRISRDQRVPQPHPSSRDRRRGLRDPRCELGANHRRRAEQTSAARRHRAPRSRDRSAAAAAKTLSRRQRAIRRSEARVAGTTTWPVEPRAPDDPRRRVQSHAASVHGSESSGPARRATGSRAVRPVRSCRPVRSIPRRPASARRRVERDRRAAGTSRQMLGRRPARATVWLPSMTRARRIQVVNGNARTAGAATSARSQHDQPEPARLQHEVHRLQRARRRRPSRESTTAATDRARRPRPTPDRSDRRYRRAPPASPRSAAAASARQTAASSVRPNARRRSPTGARAAARRRAPRQSPAHRSAARSASSAERPRQRHRARQRDVELAGLQQRFESCAGADRHSRSIFAFFRLEIRVSAPVSAQTDWAVKIGGPINVSTPPPASTAPAFSDPSARACGVHLSRFPRPVVRRLHLDGRHLDAEGRAELAGPRPHQFSPFYLGLDDFLGQLPILLFTLLGGVIADRHDRRRLLLGSQYVQMATAFTLAALVFRDTSTSGTSWRCRSSPAWRRRSAGRPISR